MTVATPTSLGSGKPVASVPSQAITVTSGGLVVIDVYAKYWMDPGEPTISGTSTFTKVDSVLDDQGVRRLTTFYCVNPTSGTYTINHPGAITPQMVEYAFTQYASGYNTTSPIVQFKSGRSTPDSTPATVTFAQPPASTSAVHSAVGCNADDTFTPSSMTELTEINTPGGGEVGTLEVAYKVGSGATSPSVASDFGAIKWCMVSFEIAEATVTPPPPPPPQGSTQMSSAGRRYKPQMIAFSGLGMSPATMPPTGSIGVAASVITANANPVASFSSSVGTSAVVGATIVFTSTSTDADSDPLTYQWTLVSKPAGSAAVLTTPTAASAGLTVDVAGNYQVQLQVTDDPTHHGSTATPGTSAASTTVVAVTSAGATDIRTTFGEFANRGGVWDVNRSFGTQIYRNGRIIRQLSTWPSTPPTVWTRITNGTTDKDNAGFYGTPPVGSSSQNEEAMPKNRAHVVWSSGGAGTITVNTGTGAPQTASIGAGASNAAVRSALAALSNVAGAGNVDVSGDFSTGYAIMFMGTLYTTNVTLTVGGSGWNVRSWQPRYNIAVGPGTDTTNQFSPYPSTAVSQCAAQSGAAWTRFQQWANVVCAYFPNEQYDLMWEGYGYWYAWSAAIYLSGGAGTVGTNQYANWISAFRNMATYIRTRCALVGGTPLIGVNLGYTPGYPNFLSNSAFYWDQFWPGDSYVNVVTFDLYNPLKSAADRQTYVNWLANQATPYLNHKQLTIPTLKTGITEWAGNHPSTGTTDDDFQWVEATLAWWKTECNAGRGLLTCYFDVLAADGDFRLDLHPLNQAAVIAGFSA